MVGYEFKTYIANGREYFLYRDKEIGDTPFIKKDFPFGATPVRKLPQFRGPQMTSYLFGRRGGCYAVFFLRSSMA